MFNLSFHRIPGTRGKDDMMEVRGSEYLLVGSSQLSPSNLSPNQMSIKRTKIGVYFHQSTSWCWGKTCRDLLSSLLFRHHTSLSSHVGQ